MKLRNPYLMRILALAGAWFLRLWMRTVRRHYDFRASGIHPTHARAEQRYLYTIWHESILFGVMIVRDQRAKVRALISQHTDGEFVTQLSQHLGLDAVRGSSTRGGEMAMLRMCRVKDDWHFTVTPDGPRGPRRQVQPGIIFLASRAELPIVVAGFGYAKAWRTSSWDQFVLPCPFSAAYCVVAPPIVVPANLDRAGLERYRLVVEARLQEVTERAEHWAETGKRPAPIEPLLIDQQRRVSA